MALPRLAIEPESPVETVQLATIQPLDTTHSRSRRPQGGGIGPDQLIVGSVLGKYELVGRIARGSTSVIFKGRHRKLRIPVAVKVLDLDPYMDCTVLRSRLLSEAVLLAHLTHPNVVRLWDVEDEGPQPYLVLEYVPGPTLAQLIIEKGPLPIPFAFAFIRQAVEGLAEAHKFGIVHRDVKPGNLLLSLDGVVKVADLGLAVVIQEKPRRRTDPPKDQPIAGTAAYLAPEQANDSSSADFRADIYSLGATLYQALTGRLPFDGRSALELIAKHTNQPPAPPRRYVRDLSEECSDLVLRMLAKKPEDRFASYEELRAALAKAVGDRRAPRPLAESFLSFAGVI